MMRIMLFNSVIILAAVSYIYIYIYIYIILWDILGVTMNNWNRTIFLYF